MDDRHPWKDFEITSAYSRAQAIADGLLVDVTAHEVNRFFKISTVLTKHAWDQCVAVPEDVETVQSEKGRLHDVLKMAYLAAEKASKQDRRTYFKIAVIPPGAELAPDGGASQRREYELLLHCGPGDNAEPVLTIMFPEDE